MSAGGRVLALPLLGFQADWPGGRRGRSSSYTPTEQGAFDMTPDPNALTIREAQPADDAALQELAALDSSRVPSGRLLVAEIDGELQAAAPLAGGPAIADPFRPTETLVSLLQLRAAQLRTLARRREPSWRRRDGRRLVPRAAAAATA
jgi:hypothetical protein